MPKLPKLLLIKISQVANVHCYWESNGLSPTAWKVISQFTILIFLFVIATDTVHSSRLYQLLMKSNREAQAR